jgi:hypothetical protein
MSNTLKVWLSFIILLILVGGGFYYYAHKHKTTQPTGPATGNVNLSQKGLIEGESGFPTATPADLQACGQNVKGGSPICTNVYTDNTQLHGLAYKLAVPPGTYEVYSYSRSNPSVGKGYYNSATKCIPTVDEDDAAKFCKKDIKLLTVTISAGQQLKQIDAYWYPSYNS